MKNLIIVFSVILVINCGGNRNSGKGNNWSMDTFGMKGGDNQGDWIVIHELGDPDKLHPSISTGAGSTYIESHIYETLIEMDNHTYEWIPVLSDGDPIVSKNKLSYTFNIRKDAAFSDGTPLDGNSFIFSLKAIKNPFTDAAPLRSYFNDVESAELVDGDPYRIRFKCSNVYFKHLSFIGNSLYAYPQHIYDPEKIMDQYSFDELNNLLADFNDYDELDFSDHPAYKFAELFNSTDLGRNPVGSGPYTFVEWNTDDKIILQRNKNYWADKSGDVARNFVERLVFKTVKEYPIALTGLKKGEIDMIRSMTPDLFYNQTNSAKFKDNYNKSTFYYPNFSYLGWNNMHPIFKNKRIRKAMSYLCNRKKIIEVVHYGDGLPAKSTVYYKRPEYHDGIKPIEFDPVKARQILTDEGWSDSDGDGVLDKMLDDTLIPFEFTILTNVGNEKRKQIGLIMTEELRKVGIKANLQTMEWSVYLDNVRDHKFDAIILGWVFSITGPDPYQVWHSSQAKSRGSNSISFSHPRVDELVELNRREFDPEKRIEYIREFQEILHEEQPYTFLVIEKNNLSYHRRFSGVEIYPFRPGYDLREWWAPNQYHRYTMN